MKGSLDIQDKMNGVIDKIKKDKEVIAIILFGSYARKKEYAGDIDLCIMLDKKYSEYFLSKKRLSYLRGIPDKFDIQIFQLLPLYIRVKILKEGKILHSKNIKKIYAIAYETIKDYGLFKPYYEDYIKAAA